MYTLTFNLTVFLKEGPLSATKSEIFNTLDEAQDRADNLDIELEAEMHFRVENFAINGKPFKAILERDYRRSLQ